MSGHFIDADDARRKVKALGVPDGPWRVGVLRAVRPETEPDPVVDLRAAVAGSVPGTATSRRGADLVMILPAAGGAVDLGARLAEAIAATATRSARLGTPRWTCGLSDDT